MPLHIINSDITRMQCDAIVDPTDGFYSGGGGTDYLIHAAAGPELDAACAKLGALDYGEAAVTDAFALPCRYVIHTAGPLWEGGYMSEPVLLRSCYINSLLQAKKLELSSVAFPLISAGTLGFPKDRVLRIAIDAISDFLLSSDGEMTVYICVIDRDSYELSREIALRRFLRRSGGLIFGDDAPAPLLYSREEAMEYREREEHTTPLPRKRPPRPELAGSPAVSARPPRRRPAVMSESIWEEDICSAAAPDATKDDLAGWITRQDDRFAVLLLELIEKKGMDPVECYKKANVSKNTFSKIKNDTGYRPSKVTVISFAIALKLSIEETNALMRSAGFAFARNNLFDLIIEFYITNGVYDIFEINSALYKYDQPCINCEL